MFVGQYGVSYAARAADSGLDLGCSASPRRPPTPSGARSTCSGSSARRSIQHSRGRRPRSPIIIPTRTACRRRSCRRPSPPPPLVWCGGGTARVAGRADQERRDRLLALGARSDRPSAESPALGRSAQGRPRPVGASVAAFATEALPLIGGLGLYLRAASPRLGTARMLGTVAFGAFLLFFQWLTTARPPDGLAKSALVSMLASYGAFAWVAGRLSNGEQLGI